MCNLRQISSAEREVGDYYYVLSEFLGISHNTSAGKFLKSSFRLVIIPSNKSEITQKDLKIFPRKWKTFLIKTE